MVKSIWWLSFAAVLQLHGKSNPGASSGTNFRRMAACLPLLFLSLAFYISFLKGNTENNSFFAEKRVTGEHAFSIFPFSWAVKGQCSLLLPPLPPGKLRGLLLIPSSTPSYLGETLTLQAFRKLLSLSSILLVYFAYDSNTAQQNLLFPMLYSLPRLWATQG